MNRARVRAEAETLFTTLKKSQPFFVIAGSCLVESRDQALRLAERLAKCRSKLDIPFIYKSSFDKANRQHISSERGPGIEKGLRILQEVKETFQFPINTDVHETCQVEQVAEVADIIQIPAFLSRQTDLIVTAGKSGRVVNIKKGQFMSPETMIHAADKVLSTNNQSVILTERGTQFGYSDLVVDFRNAAKFINSGHVVVQDVTHSVQRPGLTGVGSGGDRDMIPTIARAAAAVGVHGLFFEVHEDPEKALSDAATSFNVDDLDSLLEELVEISHVSRARNR